jgi:hypothetical protein
VVRTGHFKRECPDWKREEKMMPLTSFEEDQRSQGLFFCGSYQEPLINLEGGPNQEESSEQIQVQLIMSPLALSYLIQS